MIQSSRIPLAHGIILRQLYIIVQISDQQNVQGNTCELNQYGKLDVDWFRYFIASCYHSFYLCIVRKSLVQLIAT